MKKESKKKKNSKKSKQIQLNIKKAKKYKTVEFKSIFIDIVRKNLIKIIFAVILLFIVFLIYKNIQKDFDDLQKETTIENELNDNESIYENNDDEEIVNQSDAETMEDIENENDKKVGTTNEKTYNIDDLNSHLMDYINRLYSTEDDSIANSIDIEKQMMKIKDKKSIISNSVIMGDSYATKLLDYFIRKQINENVEIKASPGRSITENIELYRDAINSDREMVIFLTSVNDVLKQTDLIVFKDYIEELFDLANENGKILIINSNVDYISNREFGISANRELAYYYKPMHYDAIIKRSAKKYSNVIYLECNDIAIKEYLLEDGIHYNDVFYDLLFDRMLDTLLNIKEKNTINDN